MKTCSYVSFVRRRRWALSSERAARAWNLTTRKPAAMFTASDVPQVLKIFSWYYSQVNFTRSFYVFNSYPSGEYLPQSNEKVVTLTGPPNAIGVAVQTICQIIIDEPAMGQQVFPYNPQCAPTGFFNQRGHYGIFKQVSKNSADLVLIAFVW